MVNAILNGCNGAMGRVITDIVSKDDGIRIVAGVDVNPLKLADYEVYETLDQCPAADVVTTFLLRRPRTALWLTVKKRRRRWSYVPQGFRRSSWSG